MTNEGMAMLQSEPVSVVIVGAGERSLIYSSFAKKRPERMRIVGVVDPNPVRLRHAAALFDLDDSHCFENVEQLIVCQKLADAVINGTMDAMHVQTTIPLLEKGYDVLLEKPIGISEEEVLQLLEASRRYGRKVLICHVLRYAPFYVEIRKRVLSGDIGDIIHIQTEENVSYHHMAASFVRGKWNNEDKCKSTMLMQKCCHDLDIMTWMKSGIAPRKVNSFGSLSVFQPKNAPEGAGERCLTDCRIERECPYSARKNYIEQGLWGQYAWRSLEHITFDPTLEQKMESLRTDNPYGRCVWHCDNDVVDHQSVIVEWEDGSTASHSMVGGTAKPCRTIHLIGTKGEIYGVMEDGYFVIRFPDTRAGHEYSEQRVEIGVADEMHGGGDFRLVEDFVRVVTGEAPSISTTSLDESVYGHLIGFAADRDRRQSLVMDIGIV